jgi:hypothetical protein
MICYLGGLGVYWLQHIQIKICMCCSEFTVAELAAVWFPASGCRGWTSFADFKPLAVAYLEAH